MSVMLRTILATVFLMIFIGNSIGAQIQCAPPSHCIGLAVACECGGTPDSASARMAACTMICQMQVPGPAVANTSDSWAIALLFDAEMPGSSGQLIAPPVPPPRLA